MIYYKRPNYRIKLVHLLSRPTDEREQLSVASLSRLSSFGIEYVQRVNEPFKGETPYTTLFNTNPNCSVEGSYGCYLAHREAIENEFSGDLDFLAVAECDCLLRTTPEMFVKRLKDICWSMTRHPELVCTSIGGKCAAKPHDIKWDEIRICEDMYLAHFMLYPNYQKNTLLNTFRKTEWKTYDIWLVSNFGRKNKKLATSSILWTTQATGFSIIDQLCKAQPCKRLAYG